MRKGVTLYVNEAGLTKLVRDLSGTWDFMSGPEGIVLIVRLDDVHQAAHRNDEEPPPPRYVVTLDKHQRRYLENRMTLARFTDEYEVKPDG